MMKLEKVPRIEKAALGLAGDAWLPNGF